MNMSSNKNDVIYGPPSECPKLESNLGQHVLDSLSKNSTNIYQIDPIINQIDTRAEIRLRSIRTALEMQKRGLQKGDVITICAKNHPELVLPFLGALYLGVITNPLHSLFTKMELKRMLTLTKPKMIFCDEEFEALFTFLLEELKMPLKVPLIIFERDFAPFVAWQPKENIFEAVPVNVDTDIAVILSSSGTTGTMKGIPHTHLTLMHAVYDTKQVATPNDRTLWFCNLCWNASVWVIIYCALFGSIKITADRQESEVVLQIIEDYKVTFLNTIPSMLHSMVHNPNFHKYDLSSLKTVWSRGAPNTSKQMLVYREKLKGVFILNGVGMTELCRLVAAFYTGIDDEINIAKVKSHGRLCPGMQARRTYTENAATDRQEDKWGCLFQVADTTTGKSVGRNCEGELCLKADSLLKGYYKNPEATALAFDDEGWFHTGDLVYFDDDDCLYIVGRLKELLKYQTWLVIPSELEYLLQLYPGVKASCVVGIPAGIDGHWAIAFVVKKQGANITEEELIKYIDDNVNDFQRLRGGVKFLDAMPMTGSGKIRRMELQKIADAMEINADDV